MATELIEKVAATTSDLQYLMPDLPSTVYVEQELHFWRNKWSSAKDPPAADVSTAQHALTACWESTFPNLHRLLAAFPVTSAPVLNQNVVSVSCAV